MKISRSWTFTACIFLAACAAPDAGHRPTLKEAFANDFLIGAALNESQFDETDVQAAKIVKEQFNSVSPENVLKWLYLRPAPGIFDFSAADHYVDFGTKNGMFTVGHNLIWHSQNPKWLFLDDQGRPADRATMLARMREHIMTVVGRYRGRIAGWDVVNEALNDDGTLRNSPWMKAIGEDYILKAYQFAHEADPSAQLYYNDFSLEDLPKQKGAIALIRRLQSEGVHITAVGLQGHYKLDWPTNDEVDETIKAFGNLGVKVMITELDVDVLPKATRSKGADVTLHAEVQASPNPYRDGLPHAIQEQLTQRYAGLFRVFVRNRDVIQRVTFWGVTDAQSWLNDWPVEGRTSYPLLFGRWYNAKPAYKAVIDVGLGRVE